MEIRQIKLLLALSKEVLTMDEFCAYAGISKHYAYQLTANGKIKFYRPFGKLIYFKLEEVIELLTSKEKNTSGRLDEQVNTYLLKTKI